MARELLWNQEFEPQSNIPTLVIPTQMPNGEPRLVQGIENILDQIGGNSVISDQFDYSNAGEFSIRFPTNNRPIEIQILQAISDELHYWGIPTPNRYDMFDILDI
ncbi:hypothetical protein KC909_06410, partial [Candidatus Dojkabacteria bacterium]|nr:hypothetical protein [Candidatus Dojkabacteria bacterium]